MSDEMAKKKENEIKQIEEDEKRLEAETRRDMCPVCGLGVPDFPVVVMLPGVGWVECPRCGNVFCPSSVKQEREARHQRDVVLAKPKLIV